MEPKKKYSAGRVGEGDDGLAALQPPRRGGSGTLPGEMPYKSPSELANENSSQQHEGKIKKKAKKGLSPATKDTDKKIAATTGPQLFPADKESDPLPSSRLKEVAPGAFAVHQGGNIQQQEPGFISPHADEQQEQSPEAMVDYVASNQQSNSSEVMAGSDMPVAAELAPDHDENVTATDVEEQVRRILDKRAVVASEVIPENATAVGDDSRKCKWYIAAGLVLVVVIVAVVAIAVALSLGGGGGGGDNSDLNPNGGGGEEEGNLSPTLSSPVSSPTVVELMPTTSESVSQTLSPSASHSPTEALQLCDSNSECVLGSCAYSDYSPSAESVCCPSGKSERVYSSSHSNYPKQSTAYFCTGQRAGTICPTNTLCESGVCVFGKCEAQEREAGQTCQENVDCLSGVCVFGVCEESRRGDSELCEENADCLFGACAYSDYSPSAKNVCCPSGERERVYRSSHSNYPKQSTAYFCTGQANDSTCPTNTLCESGVCVFGKCEAQEREAGQTCQENVDCLSRVCVFGVCEESRRGDSELCEENADCLFGACAYSDYSPSAKNVCCPSGERERVYRSSHSNYPKQSTAYFCTGQESGLSCPTNSLCASNVCTSNVCG